MSGLDTNSTSAELARQMTLAAQAGAPLAETLEAAAEGTHDRRLARALRTVAERVRTGEPLESILTSNSPLPAPLSGLLRASLATGEPGRAVADWLLAKELASAHWRNVRSALAYPFLTLVGTYVLFVCMSIWVIPDLRDIMQGLENQVPLSVRTVYAVAEQAGPSSVAVLGVVAIILLLLRFVGGRRIWSQFLFGIPLLGPLWHWGGSSELYRSLAMLLERQIPLPEALRLTAGGISDAALAAHCRWLAERTEQGSELSRAMLVGSELPPSTFPIIRSGERTGGLASGLQAAAEMLEARLQAQSALILQLAPTTLFLINMCMYLALVAGCILPIRAMIDFYLTWGARTAGPVTGFMERGGTLSWMILIVPGLTLLITLQIFYRKRVISSSFAQLALSIAAWLMIFLGILGTVIGALSWLSLAFLPILIIALIMLVDRFRRSEHHALLNSLAFAADRGVPLPETARAFAHEIVGDTGARAEHLAEQLEAGATLSAATRGARLRLATPLRLAVNLSDVLVARGLTLLAQLRWGHDTDVAFRVIVNRLLYLSTIMLGLFLTTVFVMIKIVPVYQRMFDEFGLLLPGLTLTLISGSKWFLHGGWLLFFPVFVALLASLFLSAMYYTGWYDFAVVAGTQTSRRYWHVPDVLRVMDLFLGLRHFFWRYDASLVLRSLSLLVSQRVPLPQALTLLANVYPRVGVRARLTRAALAVERGGDWTTALQQQWLLGPTEAAVLRSAARAGNLPWALDEIGEGLMRRLTYRLSLLHSILYPILLLMFGAFVAFVTVGLMLPLISLIQGLT